MPKLFDHNGTTSTEIKKIYDHNGTTATAIVKAYDHNGSAATLVYQADQYLWNNGNTGYSIAARTLDTGVVTASNFTCAVTPTSGTRGTAVGYVTADFTGWSTLTINYTYSNIRYAGGAVGYGTTMGSFDLAAAAKGTAFNGASGDDLPTNNDASNNNSVTGTVTKTFNIASVSGNRQVGAWVHSDSSTYAARASIRINYIMLS